MEKKLRPEDKVSLPNDTPGPRRLIPIGSRDLAISLAHDLEQGIIGLGGLVVLASHLGDARHRHDTDGYPFDVVDMHLKARIAIQRFLDPEAPEPSLDTWDPDEVITLEALFSGNDDNDEI